MKRKITEVRGISVLNPTDIEEKYLLKAVEYASKNDYNHIEIVGAIHNFIHGNLDGMTYYKKYSKYNNEKDFSYIDMCTSAVNRALSLAESYGIKIYVWHHELDLPTDFSNDYPEILNENNDIELTHPLVKDFLQNKVNDFFDQYPKMTGIILTLHETKVPLLKLKNQILSKKDRVKYVVEILYNACKIRGKELIVRSFASVAEDSDMMMRAIEEVSPDMPIMDKWTQFDWPITLPPNSALEKIHNPLIIETDISGEYLGKGRIPVMFEKHITERFAFCDRLAPLGYVHRIDRNGQILFDTVNEVNLEITNAYMHGENADEAIDSFFKREYPNVAKEVKALMESTQKIAEMLLQNKGYYFMQGSYFPDLNHSKNHFYFEMMRENYDIVSDEWFVIQNWNRGSVLDLIKEKEEAVNLSENLLFELKTLNGKIDAEKYNGLILRFTNLVYAARLWLELVKTLVNYVKYFETGASEYEKAFYANLSALDKIDDEGRITVNDKNYYGNYGHYSTTPPCQIVKEFITEIPISFEAEKRKYKELLSENLTDFIICGAGTEGHRLKKEVNFSDTLVNNGELCRIPGNNRGGSWSRINGHGWFSYEIKLIPAAENEITIEIGSLSEKISLKITVGETEYTLNKKTDGKEFYTIKYNSAENENSVRIRFDRICEHTPLIYSVRVK